MDSKKLLHIKNMFRLEGDELLRLSRKGEWYKIDSSKGSLSCGYKLVTVLGEAIGAHRIVYFLSTGIMSGDGTFVDHINGIRNDNRVENLRLVDSRGNACNQVIHRKGHLPGTAYIKNMSKWRATIQTTNSSYHLGYFKTKEEANTAYNEARLLIENGNEEALCNRDKHKYIRKDNRRNGWKVFVKTNKTPVFVGYVKELEEAVTLYDKKTKQFELEGRVTTLNQDKRENEGRELGVSYENCRFYAYLNVFDRKIHLGSFSTKEEAKTERDNKLTIMKNLLACGEIAKDLSPSSIRDLLNKHAAALVEKYGHIRPKHFFKGGEV